MRGRVLVVEDDGDLRETIADILRMEGFEPVCACDGLQALDYLHRGERPRVILLDLMMPAMDGERFRAEQLKLPEGRAIPVVILSAHCDVAGRARRLALPFLAKPFDVGALLDAVGRYSTAS
jgi:CheY-like chemotaxis protein